MSWVVVGVAGTTAVLGAMQANAQRKAQQQANQQNANISAAQQEFSPWTHINPQQAQMGAVSDNAMAGAAQGALGGAMTGLSIKKNMAETNKLDQEAAAAQKAQEEAAMKQQQQQQLLNYDPSRPRV